MSIILCFVSKLIVISSKHNDGYSLIDKDDKLDIDNKIKGEKSLVVKTFLTNLSI